MNKIINPVKITLVALLGLITGIRANGQAFDGIQKSFNSYSDKVLQEKIFAHTDKNFYLAGEIFWFKIYNVDAGANQPVDVSKVAYAEVLDDANNAVLQGKIALSKGLGSGSFYLPVTLKNGNYKFRVYTNWMKNFSPELYFEKPITIVNPLADANAIAKPVKGDYDIRFFAEGGNLVNGVTSTVAFKATGADGKGIEINGVVINQRNDTVVRFQTLKLGMGSFSFTPDANNTYKVVVRIGRDNSLIRDLPAIRSSGYAMHLVTENGRPELKISTRGQANGPPLYLFAYCGRKVVLAQSLARNSEGNVSVVIDKEKLGQGINHFTLFNSAMQPVSERLYFNRPDDLLTLRAATSTQFKTRSPVALNVTANNNAGKPLEANLSVSVYRLDSLNNEEGADIVSYLWLKSELKGNIESPGYYFDVLTSETDKALDNLLLIQGWSRFNWADVLSNAPLKKMAYLPEYNGPLVTGQLTSVAGHPTTDVVAYLGIIGKRNQLYGAHADPIGHLIFNTKDIYGPGEMVLQTNTELDSTYRINITSPFSEQYSATAAPAFLFNNLAKKQLESYSINMQVQNLYSSARLKTYYKPVIDTSAFYGQMYKPYMLDDFVRFTTMEEVLREYIAEVNVIKRSGRFHIKVIGSEGFLNDGDPLVMLDGIPIFNADRVFAINPLKVQRLEMVNDAFIDGPVFADGVLNYTTYKGDMGGVEIDPKAVVLDYEGMQLQREFYSPVYDTEDKQKDHLPDFRNVLYWEPNVNTGINGKATVSFYTSDKAGKYIAVMQGLTADGQAGSYTLKFDVNR
jgi:hypothetical protein